MAHIVVYFHKILLFTHNNLTVFAKGCVYSKAPIWSLSNTHLKHTLKTGKQPTSYFI